MSWLKYSIHVMSSGQLDFCFQNLYLAKPRPSTFAFDNIVGLDFVNIKLYSKFYQKVRTIQELRLVSLLNFRFFTVAKPRPSWKKWHLVRPWLELVNINVYAKCYRNIPKGSRDRASFTFIRIWTSVKPRPMANGIWQSRGLDLLNINEFAKFHRKIPHVSRTYVTYENMMSYVRTYVTHETYIAHDVFRWNDATYENVICPN